MGHVGKAEGNHNHTQRAQHLRCDDPSASSSPNSQYGDRNEIAEVAFMAGCENERLTLGTLAIPLSQSNQPGGGLIDDTKVRVNDSGGGPDDGESLTWAADPRAPGGLHGRTS